MEVGLDLAIALGTKRLRLTRTFSNFGELPPRLAHWPGAVADVVWWANPAGDPPFANLAWTSIGGRLTLSARGLAGRLAEPITEALVELARSVHRTGEFSPDGGVPSV